MRQSVLWRRIRLRDGDRSAVARDCGDVVRRWRTDDIAGGRAAQGRDSRAQQKVGTGTGAMDEATTRGTTHRRNGRPHGRPDRAEPRLLAPTVPADLSYAAMLAGLVHELRTPVTALATGSELLLDDLDTLSRDDLQRIVETMHRGAMWLQGLIENVLFAATLAEGNVQIYPRPLDLIEIVRDVLPVVEPLLRQRHQTIRVVNRLDRVRVPADSRRIGQVLINLIANASKYSGTSTRIDVTVQRREAGVRLSVADRGPGLPPGGFDRLVVPFARSPEVAIAGIDGAGLGLAIVKSIVDLHRGTVGAHRRRGGGSTFWFELPLAPPEPLRSSPRSRDELSPRSRLA